jgi:hypothetical protein
MLQERGIDPGPDTGPQEYEQGLYLKHVPKFDDGGREPPRQIGLRLIGIGFWAGVAISGAMLAARML